MDISSASPLSPGLLSSASVTRPSIDGAVSPQTAGAGSATLEHGAEKPAAVQSVSASSETEKPDASGNEKKSADGSELSQDELKLVDELEVRDREVRQHEQAHANVGGPHTGAPQLEYTRGPDGRMYATSGEVSVDTSAVANDPGATIEKMRTVIAAALAPVEPSPQDRRVAAKAQALLTDALTELAQLSSESATAAESEKAKESSDAVNGTAETDSAGSDTNSDRSGENTQILIGADSGEERSEEAGLSASGAATSTPEISTSSRLDSNQAGAQLEMERRLVDTGVFSKVFPEGSVIEQQI